MKNKFLIILVLVLFKTEIYAQSTAANVGGNNWNALRFLGYNASNGVNPLEIKTNNITRIQVNGNTGLTAGFVGIGTNAPNSPMSIGGFQQLNAQGWNRGISLSNSSAILWENNGGNSYFMAHPSGTPNGNWYAGAQAGIGAGAAVDYSMTVYANNNYGTVNPLRSTQIYKNLLVFEQTFGRRFGVNTWNPQLAAEVYSNNNQLRLSWGSTVSTNTPSGVFTDFFTNNLGNLQIMPTGQRVGINLNANPTANLDVNGNARIRNVQAAVPNSILVGVNANGSSDVNVRRLDFTGNVNQVLLGNGTWGTLQPTVSANNGILSNGGTIQLGGACNNIFQILATSFTSSRAQFLNGNSYWMYSQANQAGGVGFGAQPASSGLCAVGNTVEISANNQSAYGNTNASGLRLTKLTSASPTIANGTNGVNSAKVLTVDQNGDVVLTNANATSIVQANNGNSVSATNFVVLGQDYQEVGDPGQLLNDREIPMRGRNILYTDEGRVGIGDVFSNPANTPLAKVDIRPTAIDELGLAVYNNNPMAAFPIYNMNGMINDATGTSENVSLYISTAGNPVKRAVGIDCYARSLTTGMNLGLSSIGENSALANVGGMFTGRGNALRNAGISTNGHEGTLTNIGGEFRAGNPGYLMGITNKGVFAQSFGGDYSYGIYAEAFNGNIATYAGYFNGDVFFNGSVYGSQFGWSDQSLKTGIYDIPNGLEIISQLTPRTYYYDTLNASNLALSSAKQYGFIAQEVETFLPEMVHTVIKPAEYDSLMNEIIPASSFKTLNYDGFIALLAQGIKEQSSMIDSLQIKNDSLQNIVGDLNDRLTQLENCLSGILPFLCQLNNSSIQQNPAAVQEQLRTAINIQLSDKNTIVLDQNVPNPFAESTVITYSIPANVGKAQIHFYDASGKLIQSVELTERGAGQLNVFGNDLYKGVYTYTLVADGQVVSTKRMVKE